MAKILAAMSGGVDSSAAAFLLKEKGYEVVGATFSLPALPAAGKAGPAACCGREAIAQAGIIAKKLGIKHYVFDLSEIFREKVLRNFYKEYEMGRTPNPCVRCNQFLKFDVLLKKAKELGADYISTGHYARIQYNKALKRFLLKKGRDKAKDQSYFLFAIKHENLKYILFPLGDLLKKEVRQIAQKAGLGSYARAESQDLCFTGKKDYRGFLSKFVAGKPGDIVDKEGTVLGRHSGIFCYTVGQRKGLGLSAKKPYYVISLDRGRNKVIVGFEEELYSKVLLAKEVNFLSIDKLKEPLKVKAKIRYGHPAREAVISLAGRNTVKVAFKKPQRAAAPGQAVVFFQRDVVVGGGIIK